jgi:hypothetical protein
MTILNSRDLAIYIVDFMRDRNGGELRDKLDSQTVADRALMLAELELILDHRGKPPNWVK